MPPPELPSARLGSIWTMRLSSTFATLVVSNGNYFHRQRHTHIRRSRSVDIHRRHNNAAALQSEHGASRCPGRRQRAYMSMRRRRAHTERPHKRAPGIPTGRLPLATGTRRIRAVHWTQTSTRQAHGASKPTRHVRRVSPPHGSSSSRQCTERVHAAPTVQLSSVSSSADLERRRTRGCSKATDASSLFPSHAFAGVGAPSSLAETGR